MTDDVEYTQLEAEMERDIPREQGLKGTLSDFLNTLERVGGENVQGLIIHFQAKVKGEEGQAQGFTWITGPSEVIAMMSGTLEREFKDCSDRLKAEQEQDQPKH